ncbi:MAG: DNA methyltransferase, partial [Anaerolineae bacterium]|nr:DNA methyltransferase [Anaerolineae bacterium]
LQILREYIPDESVDLIYLDPPFNSNRDYNVLFREESGAESEAQVVAFKDTWHWDTSANATYRELVTSPRIPEAVGRMIGALHDLVGRNQMMAYLVMMAVRLVELHRVLKPTGSLYLHCDPVASHYLKVVLDAVFGAENFVNEIIWQRSLPHGNISRKYGASHDVIFFYRKSAAAVWQGAYTPNRPEYIRKFYKYVEPDGRLYRLISCINPNRNRPNLTYEWNGVVRVWKFTRERMQAMHDAGLLVYSKNGIPSYKGYLDQMKGKPLQDVWTDIPPLMGSAAERLGYPTQKPTKLLERIILASSRVGDVVLDPFCGCGTAIIAAQQLGRRWIGIDITHLAIALNKWRLRDRFGDDVRYRIIGQPVDLSSARQLARENRYQFQWWALSLVEARPAGGDSSGKGKKGADRGIDGVIAFIDDETEKPKRAIVQVKSGAVKPSDVRDLKGVLDREKAQIGIFITLEPPTAAMRQEALGAGYYFSSGWQRDFARLQILTIEELLSGKTPDLPPSNITFKQDQRAPNGGDQKPLV